MLSTFTQQLLVNHYQSPSDSKGLHFEGIRGTLDHVISFRSYILAKTEQSRKIKIMQLEGKETFRCLAAGGQWL